MPSPLVRLCAVQLSVLAGCWGFQWTSDLPDGTVKYACVGDELALPWSYKTSPGDDITSIQWFFQSSSQEMMAFFSHGNFAPIASFANRVQHLSGAGLSLSHVTSGDTGNYSVEISGHDGEKFFEYCRTVLVIVTENNKLLTTDGELQAMLEPQAIYSNSTGQWSLVVSCGHFTFPGDPPFNMEWTTPSGAVVPSDGYKDGYFQLHVTSGGDYTCTIPQHAAADLCLHNATRHATVHVDKVEARMTLMEARQQQLEKENEQLTLKTEQLEQKNEQLTLKTEELEQENKELKQKDTSLTDYVHTLESRLDNKNTNLTDYVHTLESRLDNKDSSLTQSLQTLASKASRQVAFTARLSHVHTSGGTVKFDVITNNYGNSYNSSSGLFTAPVDGLYFFIVTTCLTRDDDNLNAYMYKDGSTLCYAATNGMPGRVASCGAAVHLTAGQTVHVASTDHLTTHYTSFSGFLVTSD